jgi:uncharacterized protein
MRFSLIPREMRFYDMLDEATVIISRAAGMFLEMVTKFDNLAERARALKVEEEKCDAVIERIIKALNISFITPFDREDIHTLAAKLDDILDNMEETAHRIAVFRIAQPTPETVTLARYVVECCVHLEKAVHLSRNLKDHEDIYKHLVEVGRLENEADNIYRNADAALFANGNGTSDILMLIKLREIYSWLEETVDACKDVANVISEIVIKGS